MVYTALAGALIALALVTVLFAGKLLFRGNWLFGWVKGMAGLLMLAAAAIVSLAALDLYSYQMLNREQPIATLSFSQQAPQTFAVSVVEPNGTEQQFMLKGDMWQMDARILNWNQALAGLGLSAGYRLDRIAGRYLSLEAEQTAERTVHALSNSRSRLDLWQWLHNSGTGLGLLDAQYGSATYLPMHDGALFSVVLGRTGLKATALNSRAEDAIASWQ